MEFDDPRDADDAVYDLNGKDLCGKRVIVEHTIGQRRDGGNRSGRSNIFIYSLFWDIIYQSLFLFYKKNRWWIVQTGLFSGFSEGEFCTQHAYYDLIIIQELVVSVFKVIIHS